MKKLRTLYVTNRKNWRKWLERNFDSEPDVWLIYPKKSSGKEKILYNDAVEEALCFGWIDSTIKTFDTTSSMQRFSPRNPKSSYSQPNKERMKWLLENDMLHPTVVEKAKEIASEKFIFPKDILTAIKKDDETWMNYNKFSETYRRIRIAYIDSARIRPEEFDKRLKNFLTKTKQVKQIGFGGIEKHY